jgi:hypothetical protein
VKARADALDCIPPLLRLRHRADGGYRTDGGYLAAIPLLLTYPWNFRMRMGMTTMGMPWSWRRRVMA